MSKEHEKKLKKKNKSLTRIRIKNDLIETTNHTYSDFNMKIIS